MGLRRLITTMSCIAAASVTASRPEAVSAAVGWATEFIRPLYAQTVNPASSTAEPAAAPSPDATKTSGERPAAAPAFEPTAATPATQPPTAGNQSAAVHPPLPNYIPGNHELTFKSDTDADAAATGSELPVVPPASAALPATSEKKPDAAAAGKDAKPARKIKSAVITIEADPRLTGAATTDKPAARPIIPAKQLFGAAKTPAPLAPRVYGYYSKGCLSGGTALPVDGPAWQAMRLSRNRNWGHPRLVKLVKRLALESQTQDNWPGLLVGDLAQPRGGPMLTGHASHQVGLDADVWLTPMPNKRLSRKEREELNATSMLDDTGVAVDPKVFTDGQVKLIKRAASYPEVERIFVHPAIKKALCEAAGTDRGWLAKVRPIYGHHYHFHIRIGCPPGSSGSCRSQPAVGHSDGCGKEVTDWLARVIPRKGPPPPETKPRKPKPEITMAQLPNACAAVLENGPNGVAIPAGAGVKAIARAPAALRPHLHKQAQH